MADTELDSLVVRITADGTALQEGFSKLSTQVGGRLSPAFIAAAHSQNTLNSAIDRGSKAALQGYIRMRDLAQTHRALGLLGNNAGRSQESLNDAMDRGGTSALRTYARMRSLVSLFGVWQAFRFGQNIVTQFDDIAKRADALGITVDESLRDKMTAATDSMSESWTRLQVAAVPAITTITSGLAAMAEGAAATLNAFQRLDAASAGQMFPNARGSGAGPAAAMPSFQRPIPNIAVPDISVQFFDSAEKIAELQKATMDKVMGLKLEGFGRTTAMPLNLNSPLGNKDAISEQINAQREMRDEIAELWDGYWQRQAENAQSAQVEIGDRLRNAFDITGAAGMRAFENIGDAAKQLLQQIVAMTTQMLVIEPIMRALFGARGEPLGGLIGGAIGKIIPGVSARAGGGPVMAGNPYLVGERGPELFVPRSGGTVVPNSASMRHVVEVVMSPGLIGAVVQSASNQAVGAVAVRVRNRGGRI